MPLTVSPTITLADDDIEWHAVRAQGAGGQNVNKVASAIHLRFDIQAASLPDSVKQQLLALADKRISKDGVIVIKAQRFRTQEKNREDALKRLVELIQKATQVSKRRVPTKPSKAAKQRRIDAKTQRGKTKALRGKVDL